MYITKEKLKDLLKVVNTLVPPASPALPPTGEAVGELLPVSADLNLEGVALAPLQKSSKRVPALDAKFTMGECSLVVRHNESKEHISGDSLLRTSFHGLYTHFQMSNQDMSLDMELSW